MVFEISPHFSYVGNLAANTSEYVIREIFSVLGSIADVKMITHEGQADQAPYCFVTFEEHEKALLALTAMNGRAILNREMRVNWATRPDGIRKDTSSKTLFSYKTRTIPFFKFKKF